MSDKELIKALQEVVEAQKKIIESYELIVNVQQKPTIESTSGYSKPIYTDVAS